MISDTIRKSSIIEDQNIDLGALLKFLFVQKWTLAIPLIIGFLIAGFYAFRVGEPQYFSVTRMAFEVRAPKLVDLEGLLPGASTDSQAINTELEIVRSSQLISSLVKQEGLLKDPEFNPTLRVPSILSLSGFKSALKSFVNSKAAEPVPTEQDILNATVKVATDKVRVSAQRDTFLFNIGMISSQPGKSIKLANALAQIYLDEQVKVKFEATEYAVEWLSQRVVELERDLKTSEEDAKRLREKSNLVSQEALDILSARANSLRSRLQQSADEVRAGELNLELLVPMIADGDFIGMADISEDAKLRSLLDTANVDNAPLLVRASEIMTEIGISVDRARARRASLETALNEFQSEIDTQTADLVRLNTLIRDVEANQALYATFLTRLKETSIQLGLQRPDSRILSEATTVSLIAPRKGMILVFGALFGAVVGFGIVMLKFFGASGLKDVTEIENSTNLPVLGQLPLVPIRKRAELLSFISENPTSDMAESIRNLRTSLLMLNIDDPPKVILLTSSLRGESKTTTSVYLAKNMADLGRRVLLLEADNRRLAFAEYFNVNADANLLAAMDSQNKLDHAVTRVEQGFDVLVGTRSPMNAADIFSSTKFSDLIDRARKEYDIIIIDSPPVLAVPDARIITPLVDAVLYCVAWNSTPKKQVLMGLRELTTIGAHLSGVVLTKVNRKVNHRYGYGGYYDT